MQQLVEKMFVPAFGNPDKDVMHDAAVFDVPGEKVAMTTDSFVVHPLFFPGGDIGSLAVHGTVNDLAMSGAKPLYLSAGFIIEEGLPMETLWRVVCSMRQAAKASGVSIITGDTKVVDKGKGDGLYINTAGIGVVAHDLTILPTSIQPGDMILINGDVARHGMAIMAVREGLEFESHIESDSVSLSDMIQDLIREGISIHCLRDVTRGGLASVLNELAQASKLGMHINENDIPVHEDVSGACEILGFDPLYVANEGKFVAFIPAGEAAKALAVIKKNPKGSDAAIIGRVSHDNPRKVMMKNRIGATRIVDMISGEQLPRIC